MMLFRDFLDFLLFSTIQDNYFWNGQVKALQIFHRFLLQRKKIKNKMKRHKKHFTILLSHSLKFVMMNWSSPPVHISWRIFIFLSFFFSFYRSVQSRKWFLRLELLMWLFKQSLELHINLCFSLVVVSKNFSLFFQQLWLFPSNQRTTFVHFFSFNW